MNPQVAGGFVRALGLALGLALGSALSATAAPPQLRPLLADATGAADPAQKPDARAGGKAGEKGDKGEKGGRLQPSGYAFDQPRILTHQMIWGVVHGVRLLALTCRERGKDDATEAWLDWQDRQQQRIKAAELDLSRYYFEREDAAPDALAQAMHLKPFLDTAPQNIGPACASLAEALQQERYDLEKYYQARREAFLKGDPDFPGAVWQDMPAEPAALAATPPASAAPASASASAPAPAASALSAEPPAAAPVSPAPPVSAAPVTPKEVH